MASRDVRKSQDAIARLKQELGDKASVEFLKLDLSDLHSVTDFVQKIKERGTPLHLLVNNAGIMLSPFRKTVDGSEQTWQTNYLGPFLLTNMLAPELVKAAREDGDARIVNVGSEAHRWGPGEGVELDQTALLDPKNYVSDQQKWLWYGNSKMAMILFTQELNSRLQEPNLYINCVHPGIIDSDLFRDIGLCFPPFFGVFGKLIRIITHPWLRSPSNGALTVLYASTSPDVVKNNQHGKYIVPCRGWLLPSWFRAFGNSLRPFTKGEIRPGLFLEPFTTGSHVAPIEGEADARSKNLELQRRLWDLSLDQLGDLQAVAGAARCKAD